ncbi:hypothetical protein GE09DRAFT_1174348 [Coniochaeta sp. 2T2.1]|nr:hypothetical protein GE09DRAFT_1174348 [Coniochaeta sp. 2T2.1]
MIETNLDPHVVPIILHFASVLAPWWTLILYTLEDNWKMPPSATFRRAVETGKLSIKFLPADTKLTNSGSVSRFLAKPWLWEQLAWAERILMFQADSILCAGAEMTVDDFVEYDLVGAPIDAHYGQGYNGGLSIRNPSLFLRITRETDFEKSGDEFEDQWFYKEAKARADKGQGVNLPEVDVAKQFAVETIDYPRPLGYHQPERWRKDQMKEIEAWCPEVRMLLGRRAL